jgi:photosystem II oxygen-evolving enhancer protein 3
MSSPLLIVLLELSSHFLSRYRNLIIPRRRGREQEATRREAFAGIAAAGAAFVPTIANAAAGESPRFSVFGLIGDGSAYSEGAAYGTDQSGSLYSPYSVYPEAGPDSLYKPGDSEYIKRKKDVLNETAKRLDKLPGYVAKSKWFEITDELTRYMYETRGAMNYLATTKESKAIAKDFFKDIETISGAARYKKGDVADAGIADAKKALDAFVKSI